MVVPGLLEPKQMVVKKRSRSQARATISVGGSASLRGVWEEGKDKQKVRKVEEERLKGVRDAREEGKKSAQEAAAALEAAWRLCPGVCSCMVVPCPIEKLELCEFCPVPVPKRGKCKVRVYVAARKAADAPLMLMVPSDILLIK